jgi:hypothetical protein
MNFINVRVPVSVAFQAIKASLVPPHILAKAPHQLLGGAMLLEGESGAGSRGTAAACSHKKAPARSPGLVGAGNGRLLSLAILNQPHGNSQREKR